jgi:hypothetical protein
MTPEIEDEDIEALFDGLRRRAPEPGEALLARIEADGLAGQRLRQVPSQRVFVRSPWWHGWLPSRSGGAAAAGLVSATLAGFWLGLVQPAPVSPVTDSVTAVFTTEGASDYADLIPFLDPYLTEG